MNLKDMTVSDSVYYIFSDFFDTLVSRNCHPEEVKMRWCSHIIDYFNLEIGTQDLYDIRVKCEATICKSNLKNTSELEFRYEQLLLLIYNILQTRKYLNISKERFFDISEFIELEIEKKVQYLNDDVVSFYKRARESNRKVYIISDFYMEAKFIEKLAIHHGVAHLIDGYFTSSDYLKTKRSGALYDVVLNEKQISPTVSLMIGDNYHSDVDMSQEHGIYSLHISRDFSSYDKSLKVAKNQRKVRKKFVTVLQENKFDFYWMVIPLFLFIAKLHSRLVKDNIKNIVFLAREGEFLKELFDIYNKNYLSMGIKSHYMLASRRGTYLPSLRSIQEEDFSKLLNQYTDMSLKVFIDSLGLSDFLNKLELELEGIDFNTSYANFQETSILSTLIENKYFQKIYEQERLSRRKCLESYVFELIGDDDLHLVDVGWRGSIQDNIKASLNKAVTGYYCGVLRGAHVSYDNSKYGLLFHELEMENYTDSLYNEFRASYEVFCSASHGSLIKYISDPEFGVLEKNEAEIKIYKEYVRPLQIELRTLFENILEVKNNNAFCIDEIERAFKPIYEKSVFFPTKIEMDKFSKLEHYENFGVFEFSSFDENSSSRLTYLKLLLTNPKHTVGKEWWKPLGFRNNRCGVLKYPYFALKKLMMLN